MKRLFHNGQPTRDGVRKIYEEKISTSPFGTLGLIASLFLENVQHFDNIGFSIFSGRSSVVLHKIRNIITQNKKSVSTIHIFIEKALFNEVVQSIFQLGLGNSSVKRRKIKSLNVAAKLQRLWVRLSSRSWELLRIHIWLTPLVEI